MNIETHRTHAAASVAALAKRGGAQTNDTDDFAELTKALADRGNKLIESWEKLVTTARHEGGTKRSYSPYDKDKTAGKPLLFTVVDEHQPDPHTDDARFAAATSMRDVEPSVHLWLERRVLGGKR